MTRLFFGTTLFKFATLNSLFVSVPIGFVLGKELNLDGYLSVKFFILELFIVLFVSNLIELFKAINLKKPTFLQVIFSFYLIFSNFN